MPRGVASGHGRLGCLRGGPPHASGRVHTMSFWFHYGHGAPGWLNTLIAYVGGYLLLVFLAICVATGLQYIAELMEEYTVASKKVLWYLTRIIGGLHVLAYFLESDVELFTAVAGAVAHVMYDRLLRRFPYCSLLSVDFALAALAFLASNSLWMMHWMFSDETGLFIACYCLVMALLVPFGFFISLSVNENLLPGGAGNLPGGGGAGGAPSAYGVFGGDASNPSRSRKLAQQVFAWFKLRRDQLLQLLFPNGLPKALSRDPAKERQV